MVSHQIPVRGYDSSLLPNQKLAEWRKQNQFPTQKDLSDELGRRIMAAFSPQPVPKGVMVHQPDVSKAEQGLPGPFKKVSSAICTYFKLPPDYFGNALPIAPQTRLEEVRESAAKYERLLEYDLRIAQSKLIEQLELIAKLHEDYRRLSEENHRLKERVCVLTGQEN